MFTRSLIYTIRDLSDDLYIHVNMYIYSMKVKCTKLYSSMFCTIYERKLLRKVLQWKQMRKQTAIIK